VLAVKTDAAACMAEKSVIH